MDFEALKCIVASDAQGRGVSALCQVEYWESALQLFIKASRIFIVTGFCTERTGAPKTNGPLGAVALGRAAVRVGKSAAIITDSRNYLCLKACSRSVAGPLVISVDDYKKIISDIDLLVFIERPGHAADGRYYNMKGVDISDVTVPLDRASETLLKKGVPVLGIGDGGNEAGMGIFYDTLAARLPHYASFLSRVPATVCLPVDVSNWGAYALTAVLSSFYRRWLGLDDGEESAMLSAILSAGDGFTGRADKSVDGISMANLNDTTLKIRNWYSKEL